MSRRAPAGLGARGLGFWRRTVASFDLSDAEIELLIECCRILDEIEELRGAIATAGITVPGSNGQPRPHPALGEARQHRLALGRLLSQLQLPDEDGDTLATPLQARGRNANRARWGHGVAGGGRGPA